MYQKPFWGTELTHEQCWDIWEAEKQFETDYHINESGYTKGEAIALKDPVYGFYAAEASLYTWFSHHPSPFGTEGFFDRETGYEAMEKQLQDQIDRDYEYLERLAEDRQIEMQMQAEEQELIANMDEFDWTPITNEPEETPYWQQCVNRIDHALGQ